MVIELNLQLISLLRDQDMGLKVLIKAWSFWRPVPSWSCLGTLMRVTSLAYYGIVERCVLWITKDVPITQITQEIPRYFRIWSCLPGIWEEDQIHVSHDTTVVQVRTKAKFSSLLSLLSKCIMESWKKKQKPTTKTNILYITIVLCLFQLLKRDLQTNWKKLLIT